MKQLFTLLFIAFSVQYGWSQCSTCTPDQTLPFTQNQFDNGGYLPAPLPPVEQGVFYDTVVTFVFPANVNVPPIGNISVDSVRIDNVTNLPPGMSWTTNSPTNTFYPQQSPYGCVRLCGTTYRAPGIDSAQVTIRGFALGQSQAQSTYIVYQIIPGSVGTGSFTATNVQGCDSVTASFEALIDATPQETSYGWDFGNGNTSTAKIPADQTYTAPGTYPVVLNTFIGDLVLSSVTISSTNENWEDNAVECNDLAPIINTPLCANRRPDLFIVITDLSSGTEIYTSNSIGDQNAPVSYNNINTNLTGGGPYSITIWDDDSGINPTSDDLIGTYGLSTLAEGTYSFGSGQTTGSYTLVVNVIDTITDTIDVIVNASPAMPVITNVSGVDTVCAGDSIVLSVDAAGNAVTWYRDGNELTGIADTFITVTQTGNYSVRLADTVTTCQTLMDTFYRVVVNPTPASPVIIYQANDTRLAVNNGSTYDRQWYFNGVPVPGQTDVYYNNPAAGTYSVEYTNQFGCKSFSGDYDFNGVGILEPGITGLSTRVYPNPNNGRFTIEFNALDGAGEVSYKLFNLLGQTVAEGNLYVSGSNTASIDLADATEGVYLLRTTSGNIHSVEKVIIRK